MLLVISLLLVSFANAGQVIEVTEPAFTAEKIEFNKITNSYVVVMPKYFINARDSVKIVSYGNYVDRSTTAKHLCTFLGMGGGSVISDTRIDRQYDCNGKTLHISNEGKYGMYSFSGSSGCSVIDFLECTAKQ